MSFDNRANLAYSTIAVAPSPAGSGTTLTVGSGHGSRFPSANFVLTVWAAGEIPVPSNAEILYCTSRTGDVLTVLRAQEGTSARTILVGDQVCNSITVKALNEIEAAIPSTAGLLSNINVSAGATSNNLSALTFSNANGVSFGLTGSTITATVATAYQSQGAYLTTAALSQDSSKYAGTNGAITGGSITVNTSGVSVNLPAYLTTAMASDAVTLSNIKVSAGASSANLSALTFSNSNGLAFGLNAGTITGSYTVPTVTAGSDTLGMSNLGNTAGTTGVVSGDAVRLLFAGGNNITLSQSVNGVSATITISGANAGGAQTGISGLIVSDATYSSGTVSFSNAGNITISSSVNGATQFIRLSGNAAQTNQSAIKGFGVSNTGQTAGNTGLSTGIDWVLAGSGSITLSQSTAGGGPNTVWVQHPAWISSQSTQFLALTLAGNTAGTSTFHASNNASLFLNGGNNITLSGNGSTVTISAAAQTNQSAIKGLGASNTGNTAGNTGISTGIDWVIAGSNNITISQSTAGGGPNTLWVSGPTVGGAQTGISGIVVSDTTYTSGTVSFSNQANVTIGSSANGATQYIRLSVAPVTNSSWTVSDNATSATVGRLAFTQSNGLTLSLSTSNNGNHTVIGSYTVPTLTNSSLTMQAGASTLSSVSRIAFVDSNGVSFGASTSNNGSISITATVKTDYLTTQSTQYLALTLGGNTAGTTTFHATNNASLWWNGGNNITLSGNGSTVTISAADQSVQTLGGYAVGNTTGQSSSSTFDARTLSFNGAGNVSVGYSAGSVVISGGTAAPSPVNFSAGTTSGNLGSVVFSNSNGVSFGLNGSTVTATVSTYDTVGTATTGYPVASANSIGTVTRWAAEDHRHAGIGAIGISTGNTTGTSGSVQGTYWFAGSNGLSVSQITSNNGSHTLVMVGQPPLSYWKNAAAENLNQTQTMSLSGSTSYIQPLVLDKDVSASYMRFLHSFAVTNTTSIATSNNATGSCSLLSTLFVMLYTKGTGASSNSLQSYLSSSVGLTQVWSLSAANGSQWTLSQSITHPVTGNTSQFTTGVTTSLSNYSLGSASLTRFTGLQHLDIPFATLLSAGNYWVAFGQSSASSTGGSGGAFTQLRLSNSIVAMSQINSAIPLMGAVTAGSVQYGLGHGSFSTNAIGTTASLDFSNISSSASHPLLPIQLMRIT